MENFIYQTLGMSMFLSPEGDDGGTIKFGGIEVDLNADPEELKASILKANEAYKASSTQGINAKKELDAKNAEIAKLKEMKKEAGKEGTFNGMSEEAIQKYIDSKLEDVNNIAKKGKQFNLEREVEKSKESLRQEFSYLDDETFNEAMKDIDTTFKNQDEGIRSGAMYKNIAEVKLSKALRQNLKSIDSKAAMDKIMSDPEALKQVLERYSKESGIDVNIPEGGFTDQPSFETKVSELQKEFKKERDPRKRAAIAQKVADIQSEGKKYGFKL